MRENKEQGKLYYFLLNNGEYLKFPTFRKRFASSPCHSDNNTSCLKLYLRGKYRVT